MRFVFLVLCLSFTLSLFGYNADDLFTVAKTGTKSQVEMILKDGVEINVRDSEGNSPLILAAFAGRDEVATYLVEKGADIEARNNLGMTALMAASSKGQLKVVKVLLNSPLQLDAKDSSGNSALMLAAGSKNSNVVKLLVTKNIDINASNAKGETALTIAAHQNNKDIAAILYAKGAIIPENFAGTLGWIKDLNAQKSEGVLEYLNDFAETTSFYNLSWGNILMILTGMFFIFLAIKFGFEPLLLIPIGFGMIIGNVPVAFGDAISLYEQGSVLSYLYFGVKEGIYPPLIFLGIGALTDFSYMISNPKLILLGAGAQVGIFVALFIAYYWGFNIQEAASIGIIGGADGPTTIFTTSKMAPYLLGATAVAGYSYMALVPVIQRPIIYMMTTKKERLIRMASPRIVGRTEKLIFPVATFILCCFVAPGAIPLMGMLLLGNLLKESGQTDRLAKTAGTALIDIVTILVGLCVGASASADYFWTISTVKIVGIGLVAFICSTIGGIAVAKIMNLFLREGNKINPIIGCAGVSAVPIAARVAQSVGRENDPDNHLLMHAMAPNVAGVIGSAIAAGILLGLIPH